MARTYGQVVQIGWHLKIAARHNIRSASFMGPVNEYDERWFLISFEHALSGTTWTSFFLSLLSKPQIPPVIILNEHQTSITISSSYRTDTWIMNRIQRIDSTESVNWICQSARTVRLFCSNQFCPLCIKHPIKHCFGDYCGPKRGPQP